MGGQLNYFGLWLSAEYGTGHSKGTPKCSTYGSPVLAHNDEFHIDVLEVWGIGEPVIPEKEVCMCVHVCVFMCVCSCVCVCVCVFMCVC